MLKIICPIGSDRPFDRFDCPLQVSRMYWFNKQFEVVALFTSRFYEIGSRRLSREQQNSALGVYGLELHSKIDPVQLRIATSETRESGH
jgi:hypothetical protein